MTLVRRKWIENVKPILYLLLASGKPVLKNFPNDSLLTCSFTKWPLNVIAVAILVAPSCGIFLTDRSYFLELCRHEADYTTKLLAKQ